jgi:hypothetical protein
MGDFLTDHDASTNARRKREAFDGKPKALVLILLLAALVAIIAAVVVLG